MQNIYSKYFSPDDIKLIEQKISAIESSTSGEIKISIKKAKGFFNRKKAIHDLAIEEFNRLKLYQTIDRTGVLLLIFLRDKQFTILGDIGINEKITQEFWDSLANNLILNFKAGKYKDGIIEILGKIGEVLSQHFPHKKDDKNEISDNIEFS